jgi:hypothetical protein
MIGRAYPYNGSEADARRLDCHLWKDDGQRPKLSEIRNLFVHGSADGMAVMAALRAASNAKIAFWHIIVSPRKTLNQKERVTVVDLVIAELKATEHPLMVFSHNEKPRARKGGGANHLHLVLGHVSPVSFRALDMRQHAPRLHKVMALAAYHVEGVATASPWHKSIVMTLRGEGNPHVADWLVDSLGEAPVLRHPRMTDRMRRSTQASGFALASFQAGVERLWTMGATQSEMEAFSSANGVAIQTGQSPTMIVFYHGALFLGTLDRILRQDARTVYEEAKHRVPRLLGAGAVQAFSDVRSSGMQGPEQPEKLQVPALTRPQSLARQRKVDQLEDKLTSLRLERLHLVYEGLSGSHRPGAAALSPRPLSEPGILLDHDGQSRERAETSYPANPHPIEGGTPQDTMADRINRLLHAEAILETAVMALWQDHSWTSASFLELMRFAEKTVNFRKVSAVAGAGTSVGEADAEVGHEISGFPRPR